MAGVLGVFAHPDDEISAAGYLARLAADDSAALNVVTVGTGVGARGEQDEAFTRAVAVREKEFEAALRVLHADGAFPPTLPYLRDNEYELYSLLGLIRFVEELIATHQPSLVLTHHAGDLNGDHRRVHQAVVTATRPLPGCSVREVLACEVPSSTEWAFGGGYAPFTPTVFVDITSTLEQKLAALRCYESEARVWPHPRSPEAVEARARYWGSVIGCAAAEPFMLVREVR